MKYHVRLTWHGQTWVTVEAAHADEAIEKAQEASEEVEIPDLDVEAVEVRKAR